MTKREKLLSAIRNNSKSVRYDDACKAAESLGFALRGGEGSHRVYAKPGEPVILNFQNRRGLIAEYQAKQLIAMIDQYEEKP